MAVLGTGIDIVEIQRIRKAVGGDGRFLDRVFTEGEREYFKSRKGNPCHIAGTFAAKEAVLKALGTGLRDINWKDIEILRDGLGMPYVILHGNGRNMACDRGIERIHISISHGRDHAVAQALAEGERLHEGCDFGADEKD